MLNPFMLRIIYTVLIGLSAGSLPAQNATDSVRLSGRFVFAEGLYLNWESVRQNRPDHSLEALPDLWVANPETRLARLAEEGSEATAVDPLDVVAIGRDSLLFLRLDEMPPANGVVYFSGLWVQGRICLYRYERQETRMVEIKAYNPQTGRPFRSGKVPRDVTVEVYVMVDFPSGQRMELDRTTLFDWIGDDTRLLDQVRQLPEADLDLFRVLQTYNRRNPAFIRKQ